MKNLAALVVMCCLAVACRHPAPVTLPTATPPPAHFGTTPDSTEAEPVTEAWWTRFGDPRLDELVDRTLQHNRDLAAAAARLERAEAEARMAGANLRPTVSVDPSFSRQRQNFIGFPIPGASGPVLSTISTRYGISIQTRWEVDLWGRLRAGSRAALADYQATREELRGARLSLVAQTIRGWFALLEADEQLQLAIASADSFRRSADRVRARFESGLRPAIDLRLALSNLYQAQAQVVGWRQRRDTTTRQLEILVGVYPAGRLADELGPGGLPDPPAAIPLGLPSTLIARRPDLSAAERRISGAEQRTLAARRALYPRLTLTGGAGTASDELGDLLDGDFRVWSLVAGLTQPLFQGGRLRAELDRTRQIHYEQVAAFQATALRAYGEVESALVAEAALAETVGHFSNASQQLVAAVELAEDRYRNGVGDYLTVLESQTRALQAQTGTIDARRQLLDNRVNLHLALGGGFAVETLP